ncbi:MAG TPA: NAD(P)H-hydrate dehydratase, partial [Ilumatobacteraceae bacterium]|nr:NAD(P)H-hydrate dehydratase [Ilumatobacteraceae bacterium]
MSRTLPSPRAERRLDRDLLRSWPLPSDAEQDKRGRGTVLVVGGSAATPGAVLLAATAALRVGAGRLQIATAAEVVTAVAVAMPEALVVAIDGPELADLLATADAVAVGPGLRDEEAAADLLALAASRAPATAPLVVDALALRALARGLGGERAHLVLTPNREELAELVGTDDHDDPSRAAALRYGAAVVCFERVVTPDGDVYVDDHAVAGLGTSGAGDVLAGAVAGLAARCGDGPRAAAWGAAAHL